MKMYFDKHCIPAGNIECVNICILDKPCGQYSSAANIKYCLLCHQLLYEPNTLPSLIFPFKLSCDRKVVLSMSSLLLETETNTFQVFEEKSFILFCYL